MSNFSVVQQGNRFVLRRGGCTAFLEVQEAGILRFCACAPEAAPASWAVSACFTAQPCEMQTKVSDNEFVLRTPLLTAVVCADFSVRYLTAAGAPLCLPLAGGRHPFAHPSLDGNAGAEGIRVQQEVADSAVCAFWQMPEDAHFYGLGLTTGALDKRGSHYCLWNSDVPDPHVESQTSLYESVPFFLCKTPGQCFGILADNPHRTWFDFGHENDSYFYFSSDGGVLDYTFFYGPLPADVLTRYTSLTGRMPLPPKWALGYQQCRWSYAPESCLMEIAQEFRSRNIPCDALYLDIDYMDGYRDFTWNPSYFPQPGAMIQKLSAMGFHLVTILDPGVKKDAAYSVYQEGHTKGYFVKAQDGSEYVGRVWPGAAVFPDFTRDEVRQWWGEKQAQLQELGVAGIWNDMDEPASFDGELPDSLCFGEKNAHRNSEIHNVYGSLMAKASYEGFCAHAQKRPLIITRACYAGVQKYAAVWTGDNQSMWEHLRLSLPQQMNLGMSGIPFCGSDIGGFQSNCTAELLARWTEAACLSPLFRNHSCSGTRSQEPWAFGPKTEAICKKYIALRYQLLPYLYDVMYEASLSGMPAVRPLVLEFPEDSAAACCNDEFLSGHSLLAAPVVAQGKPARSIYLPQGIWYDFWTDAPQQGGRWILRQAPLDVLPLYCRSGAILPMAPVRQHVSTAPEDTLSLHVFPGNGVYRHYSDDGETFAYQDGACRLTEFRQQQDGPELTLSAATLQSGYPNIKWLDVTVHGICAARLLLNGAACSYTVEGKKTQFTLPAQDFTAVLSADTEKGN
jgi:alpha-glucosidase